MKRSVFFLLMSFFSMGIVPAAQASAPLKERPKMEAAVKILKEQNVEHYIFTNPQGSRFLVVPKFGARILAVNVGGDNLFWTHPDISKGQGGQRTWISPEGGQKGLFSNRIGVVQGIFP